MVSLKKRERINIQKALELRARKFAIILDAEDYNDMIDKGIRKLNEVMFNPRNVLIEGGTTRMDVTHLHIDEMNNVYYPPQQETNFMFQELGIIPFISTTTKFHTLEGVTEYLNLKSVLNLLNRQMDLDGDWELFPVDSQGRQFLQLRNQYELVRLEFLPFLDPSEESWELYENEYLFLFEYVWALCNEHNAEMATSAITVGVGKEFGNVLTHWSNKRKEILDDFEASSIITYIQ